MTDLKIFILILEYRSQLLYICYPYTGSRFGVTETYATEFPPIIHQPPVLICDASKKRLIAIQLSPPYASPYPVYVIPHSAMLQINPVLCRPPPCPFICIITSNIPKIEKWRVDVLKLGGRKYRPPNDYI